MHQPQPRHPSYPLSRAVLYLTMGIALAVGLALAWRAMARRSRSLKGSAAPARHLPRRVGRVIHAIDTLTLGISRRNAPDVTWIADDLAIGGRIREREWEALARAGLGAVVDCRAEGRDPAHVLESLGIDFLHLPTPDAGDFTAGQVAQGVGWVEDQLARGRRVLVHCRAGKGRSILIAAAVLSRRGVAPDEALALIRSRRPIVTPTPGQIARLRAFAAIGLVAQAAEQTVEIVARSDNQITGG
jgi:protein tyrosine phosphatase (PTP) superfamily phosphohydrolase (DUF442 family)